MFRCNAAADLATSAFGLSAFTAAMLIVKFASTPNRIVGHLEGTPSGEESRAQKNIGTQGVQEFFSMNYPLKVETFTGLLTVMIRLIQQGCLVTMCKTHLSER